MQEQFSLKTTMELLVRRLAPLSSILLAPS